MTHRPEPARSSAVVIIGRNEGERLRRCLGSLSHAAVPVVYVDSGSTDGSVEAVASFGAEVVRLDMSIPFTAARARNEGFRALKKSGHQVEFVQFVDGDCELDAGWMDAARAALRSDPTVAAVCGHLREREPGRSIYNRLADAEWKRPVGDVPHCGGIFMVRADVFDRVGGFDPAIGAGEEPELCARMRAAGLRVVRIDVPMATHDLAMSRFSQWWRRSVRGGYGALQLTCFGPAVSRDAFRRQVRSVVVWAFAVPLLSVMGAAIALAARFPLLAVLSLAAWPGLALAQIVKLTVWGRRRGLASRHAVWYAVFTMLWKYAAACGFVRCLLDRASGGAGRSVVRVFHKAGA